MEEGDVKGSLRRRRGPHPLFAGRELFFDRKKEEGDRRKEIRKYTYPLTHSAALAAGSPTL